MVSKTFMRILQLLLCDYILAKSAKMELVQLMHHFQIFFACCFYIILSFNKALRRNIFCILYMSR